MITVTVADVVNAIEQNGYEQIKGDWVKYEDGRFKGCAIGQGAINLGVDYNDLTHELHSIRQDKRKDYSKMSSLIMYLNDRRNKTIPEIVAEIREKFAGQMGVTLTLRTKDYTKMKG